MWQIKKLPFYIDLVFCLVLLPAMITLLPLERWLVNDSLFVYLLVSWLYIVYILNRRLTMPLLFIGNRRFLVALVLILLTLAGTYYPLSDGNTISPDAFFPFPSAGSQDQASAAGSMVPVYCGHDVQYGSRSVDPIVSSDHGASGSGV